MTNVTLSPCCEEISRNDDDYCHEFSQSSEHHAACLSNSLSIWVMAFSFFFAILSKALLLGTLPLAGAYITNQVALLTTFPIIALMIGWMIASQLSAHYIQTHYHTVLTAAPLCGILGGFLFVAAIINFSISTLIAASFLMGIAQGSGLFIRHIAALKTLGGSAQKLSMVFGASIIVGLAGPALASFFENLFAPQLFIGTAFLAVLIHTLSVFVSFFLIPSQSREDMASSLSAKTITKNQNTSKNIAKQMSIAVPTLMTATAWFFMMMSMTSGPLALAICGIGAAGATGAVSWHLMAMFAPSYFLNSLRKRFTPQAIATFGIVLCMASMAILLSSLSPLIITLSMIMSGIGWSLTSSASTLWLGEGGAELRRLSHHDMIVFAAAILGALSSSTIFI